jgi:hypothetical protein
LRSSCQYGPDFVPEKVGEENLLQASQQLKGRFLGYSTIMLCVTMEIHGDASVPVNKSTEWNLLTASEGKAFRPVIRK